MAKWAKCAQPSNWWAFLFAQKLAYGQSAAYPGELDGLSRQVSGPEDPAEPRAGTPCVGLAVLRLLSLT